jgi:putative ABC transport system ATP-binding protein
MTFYDRDKKSRIERGKHLLNQVGLGTHIKNKPGHMSGGQRQRVAIARALACNPSIVLADEPTGNLDKKTAEEIIALLRRLNKEEGVTFVFSSHDPNVVAYAKRRIIIDDRKLFEEGRVKMKASKKRKAG